jgi:class 3 adenylate cyclase/CHASE2 domain-containing sensor protein
MPADNSDYDASTSASRAWANPRARQGLLFLIVVAIVVAAMMLPSPGQAPLDQAERVAFDLQMNALRALRTRAIADDIVLVGLDETTVASMPEPLALWHRHLASVADALAVAKPRAVGIDVVLPERSYDKLLPGGDLALIRSLFALGAQTKLVIARTVDQEGRLATVHPTFTRMLGEGRFGLDQQLLDPDYVARRFDEAGFGGARTAETLSGQIARGQGRPVGAGYIDFSVGERFTYIPVQSVIALLEKGDEPGLRKLFEGRIVVIGSVLRGIDRWQMPAKLIDWEHARGRYELSQPGMVIHAQVLRSLLGAGLVSPLPAAFQWAACLLAATLVFVRSRGIVILAGVVGFPVAWMLVSLLLLDRQVMIPTASVILTAWLALALRGSADALDTAKEKSRLKQSFAGQVSPDVLQEIVGGGLSPGVSGRTVEICVLFSDVRGFTALSESMSPEKVTLVLQRYFDRMVRAVHRHEGTVDKFIGDGMMVLFGAPRASKDACGNAVSCALDMMEELDRLNAEFRSEGLPILVIGIGINYGSVVVGNIGSSERHNYSAIGDTVNVAARIEGLTKDLGRKIIITDAVVNRLGERFQFDPLGEHNLKGHSPVSVWGIRTAKIAVIPT